MTPEAFSDLASRLGSGVQVRPVLDAVQFRVGDRAFATLGWPAAGWAVVKLSRVNQGRFLRRSDAVTAEPGRRRDTGVTLVRLQGVDENLMAEMLIAAFSEVYREGGREQRAAESLPWSRGREPGSSAPRGRRPAMDAERLRVPSD